MNELLILLQTTQAVGAGATIYWIVFIALMIISGIVSRSVKSKFKTYSKRAMNYGMTGRDVAEKMLYDNDIQDVKIKMVQGTLTDHYNPVDKTLNLSPDVYRGTSVAAAAVAAHECGHAVQHATAYRWLTLRSKLVPAVNITSKCVSWVLLAGIALVNVFPGLLLLGIAMFALSTLFSIVTLPVEIDASKRALVWLNSHNVTSPSTHPYAESALRSAAYTYVIAALTSLATLLYYVLIYMGRRS